METDWRSWAFFANRKKNGRKDGAGMVGSRSLGGWWSGLDSAGGPGGVHCFSDDVGLRREGCWEPLLVSEGRSLVLPRKCTALRPAGSVMITGPGGFCFGDNGFAGFHRGLAGDAQIVGWGCLFREGSGDLGIWDGGMKQTDERVELVSLQKKETQLLNTK